MNIIYFMKTGGMELKLGHSPWSVIRDNEIAFVFESGHRGTALIIQGEER